MNLVHRKRYTAEFKAQAIELLSTGKPVSQVAEELCMSSNLLYRWSDRIAAIFQRHRRRDGYRRIGEELSDAGVVCAPDRIRRIMRQRGLRAIQPKTCVLKTSDGRADKPSPNLLLSQPLPTRPDQV